MRKATLVKEVGTRILAMAFMLILVLVVAQPAFAQVDPFGPVIKAQQENEQMKKKMQDQIQKEQNQKKVAEPKPAEKKAAQPKPAEREKASQKAAQQASTPGGSGSLLLLAALVIALGAGFYAWRRWNNQRTLANGEQEQAPSDKAPTP